ncbi:MAG: hypothetical protein DMD64_03865 [Gemmatimonadetes bacterium]|nr:MAG: hypothetical protein DMD64_03865 [Gemmatimonadota bacterium]
MVDPLQGTLVRHANAILIELTGRDDVRTERFVLVAGGRILVGRARRVIDAAPTGHLQGLTLKYKEVKPRRAHGRSQCLAVCLAARGDECDRSNRRDAGERS